MRRKLLFLLCTTWIYLFTNAQDVNSLCCKDANFTEKTIGMEDALANPESVVIFDLSLQDPKLTTISEQISKFPNIRCLDVSYNRVGSIHPSIKNLEHLQCLDLSGNHYLQKLPDFLNEMPNLKVIKLEDLNWSENKKEQTVKQFPNIHFVW